MRKVLLTMLVALMAMPKAWAADGDTFTAQTTEGVTMTFKVISEAENTCQVGLGTNTCCIDNKYAGEVTVPATANGYTVTTIGTEAFISSSATSIVLPEGLTTIGELAFFDSSGFTSITLPSTLTSIGEGAFKMCSLTSLTIPEGITAIPADCADQCEKLASVVIPASVTSIGETAFRYCPLTRVEVNNPTPVAIDQKCFTSQASATLYVPYGSKAAYQAATYWGEFKTIYEGVFTAETVEGVVMTFKMTSNSTCQVGLGDGSLSLEENRAIDKDYAGKLTIPATVNGLTVTQIADYAMTYCNFTELDLPSTITYMGNNAVTYNYGITKVTAHMTTPPDIHNLAFTSCNPNMNLYVTEGCVKSYYNHSVWKFFKRIMPILDENYYFFDMVGDADYVVYRITSKTQKTCMLGTGNDYGYAINPNYSGSITIPATVNGYQVTEVGRDAFRECDNLTDISLPEGVKNIYMQAFYYCTALATATLPSTLKTIGNSAFMNCSSLETITLPQGITTIGQDAFKNCTNLDEVVAEMQTPPSINSGCFTNYDATLYVPASSKEAYQAATGWKNFKNISDALIAITPEGVKMFFIVTSEENKTCRVGSKKSETGSSVTYQAAIPTSYTGYVTVPDKVRDYTVTSISPSAFYNTKITGIGIPNTVKSIGSQAFYGCTGLTALILPEGVTTINGSAFRACSNLAVVMLPSSLNTINDKAFYNCKSVIFVSMSGKTSLGSTVFDGDKSDLKPTIQNIMVSSPTPIHYPSGIANTKSTNLFVPSGSKEAYLAAGWTGFKNIIESGIPNSGLKGDVNGDNKVTITDAVTVVNIILNSPQP